MSDRTPERGEIALRDTWKLEDIYATQAAWEADYEKASALLAAFPAYEGRLGSLDALKEALTAATELNRLGESLFTYARMKRDEDNRKTEYQALAERAQSLLVQGETAMAFMEPELLTQPQDSAPAANWEQALRQWADQALGRGQSNLLDSAVPAFERIMIETALKHTAGRRRDAAVLLGWGRNTLTRKIKELGMNVDGADDEGDD